MDTTLHYVRASQAFAHVLGREARDAWWIFKKLFKLAIYAGIIGVVAWFFYFQS